MTARNNLVLFTTLALFAFNYLSAQTRCGQDADSYPANLNVTPTIWETYANLNKPDTAGIIIPVVFHVLYANSQENLPDSFFTSQIEVINQDYKHLNPDSINTPQMFVNNVAGWGVTFKLANIAPNGSLTNGIHRVQTSVSVFNDIEDTKYSVSGGADAWDSEHYLNVWVCNMGNSYLGASQFPGGNPITDGVVVHYEAVGANGLNPNYNKGRTLTHEIGHYFGLKHIWGNVAGDCVEDDDMMDTPFQKDPTFGCLSGVILDSCTFSPTMYMNYMDYTNDACMNLFTSSQMAKMYWVLNVYRPALMNSYGYIPNLSQNLAQQPLKCSILLYPNPVQSQLTIEIQNVKAQNAALSITNTMGAKQYEKAIYLQAGNNLMQLEVNSWEKGIYFLELNTNYTKTVEKFVIL